MHTWKLEIEYEGTRYRGWQIQHNEKTIQGELLNAACQLFSARTELGGAGNTDAGVHALRQIAHLKVGGLTSDVTPKMIQIGFNDLLPHDINILKVSNASENFDARRDAVGQQFLYQISTRRTAFAKNMVWWVKDELDPQKITNAAEMLRGRHNFESFCQRDEQKKQTFIAEIQDVGVFLDEHLICLRIRAGHFLPKMIQRIVGMLVEVGGGNLADTAFQRLLKYPSGVPAKFAAPASGLFLETVYYNR